MDLYFNCHSCGKCCNSNPALLFEEIFDFYDKFILSTYMRSFYESDCNSIDKKVYEHIGVDKLLQGKHPSNNMKPIRFNIYPIGYGYLNNGKCRLLDNNGKCSVYENRPSICHLVPANSYLPLDSTSGKKFYEEGCLKKEHTEGFSPIFLDWKLQEPYLSEKNSKDISQIKNQDIVAAYLNLMTELDSNFALQVTGINGWRTTHISFLLMAMYGVGKLTAKQGIKILETQISMINREVQEALIRKNKDERAMTNELRTYINPYIIGIKYFEELNSDSSI